MGGRYEMRTFDVADATPINGCAVVTLASVYGPLPAGMGTPVLMVVGYDDVQIVFALPDELRVELAAALTAPSTPLGQYAPEAWS